MSQRQLVGERLHPLALEAWGFTREAIADRLKMHPSTINRYGFRVSSKNRRRPSLLAQRLAAIAATELISQGLEPKYPERIEFWQQAA